MVEENRLCCSFTGHRRIEPRHRQKMSDILTRAINFAYSEGCRDFLSGGAVGFDTLVAREVIRFRIAHPDVRLVMVLPCVAQDERWSDAQRDAYYYILRNADEVIYVCDEYTPDCMRKRNLILAERCEIMISYVSHSKSGSAQTESMAKRLNKRVYNLYPTLEKECVESI